MKQFGNDLAGEVIGVISLAFMGIIYIIILVSLGDATGQGEIVTPMIQAIMILIFGIGLPVGVVALIKFLGRLADGNGYY